MLRPADSLLGSSRAARRASFRAERAKALGRVYRALKGLFSAVFGNLISLLMLWATPLAYMAASYFALDLPARVLCHRPAFGRDGLLLFAAALLVSAIGVSRAVRGAEPVVPVRPQFARAMFCFSWVAALLLTIGDLAS